MHRRAAFRQGGDYNSWTRLTRPEHRVEESMEKVLSHISTRRHPWTTARWTHHPLAMVSDGWSPDLDVLAMEQAEHDNRLPPTRAARTQRSRGVFLESVRPVQRPRKRLADLAIAALAVAVVAISSALIMGAPATIMGAALNFNPGPGIVGSASVPPAFMEPSKGR